MTTLTQLKSCELTKEADTDATTSVRVVAEGGRVASVTGPRTPSPSNADQVTSVDREDSHAEDACCWQRCAAPSGPAAAASPAAQAQALASGSGAGALLLDGAAAGPDGSQQSGPAAAASPAAQAQAMTSGSGAGALLLDGGAAGPDGSQQSPFAAAAADGAPLEGWPAGAGGGGSFADALTGAALQNGPGMAFALFEHQGHAAPRQPAPEDDDPYYANLLCPMTSSEAAMFAEQPPLQPQPQPPHQAAAAPAAVAAAAALGERWEVLRGSCRECRREDFQYVFDGGVASRLGEGGHAQVVRAMYGGDLFEQAIEVAVKLIRVGQGGDGGAQQGVTLQGASLEEEEAVLQELEHHLHAQRHGGGFHPHICHVHAFCRQPLAIIMEQCVTSLHHRLDRLVRMQQLPPPPSQQQQQPPQHPGGWREWLGLLTHLGKALAHLHHSCALLHNDVHTGNALLQFPNGGGGGLGELKLADFGLARRAGGDHGDAGGAIVPGLQGPMPMDRNPLWCAPELMRAGTPVTLAADVYSAGCMMLEVMTGNKPWLQDLGAEGPVNLDGVKMHVRCQAEGGTLPPLEFPDSEQRLPWLRDPPPLGFKELFAACCSMEAGERPQADGLLARLRGCLELADAAAA